MGLGINCKLYYNTSTFGSPTWVALTGVSELSVDSSTNSADASTRTSSVVMEEPTRFNISIKGKILADASAGYLALQTAYYAKTTVDVLCLDGANDANGAEGVRFVGKLHSWGESQGLDDYVFRDFEIKPSSSNTNLPKSVIVSTGSPVFTTIA